MTFFSASSARLWFPAASSGEWLVHYKVCFVCLSSVGCPSIVQQLPLDLGRHYAPPLRSVTSTGYGKERAVIPTCLLCLRPEHSSQSRLFGENHVMNPFLFHLRSRWASVASFASHRGRSHLAKWLLDVANLGPLEAGRRVIGSVQQDWYAVSE